MELAPSSELWLCRADTFEDLETGVDRCGAAERCGWSDVDKKSTPFSLLRPSGFPLVLLLAAPDGEPAGKKER